MGVTGRCSSTLVGPTLFSSYACMHALQSSWPCVTLVNLINSLPNRNQPILSTHLFWDLNQAQTKDDAFKLIDC